MGCVVDVTDKVEENTVPAGALALNTKRIREMTSDLKAATDCEHIKLLVTLIGNEIKEELFDAKEEAKKVLEKYFPILKIPTNPLKIIPWVKKLVAGSILPQIEAYIKLMSQILELVKAINDFLKAVDEVKPKLKRCAEEVDDLLDRELKEAKDAIEREVAKVAGRIIDDINKILCESGIASLVNAVNDAINVTEDLIDEVKATKDTVNDLMGDALTSVGTAGSAVSTITGVPFEVDTSSPEAFTATVEAGKAAEFVAGVNEFIAAPAPVNTTPPSLSGSAVVGETLTVNTGVWTGSNIAYSYSWFKNDEPIYGANSSTYVPVANDVGYAILCSVSADNPAGGDIANTPFTSNVTSNAPICSVLPVISGAANVGEVLSITSGTWSGSPTIEYQWMWSHVRLAIHNANNSTYTVAAEDIGQTLTCRVTATSSGGSNSVHAVATSIVGTAEAGGGATNFDIDIFTGNSSNTVFTLTYESTTNNAIVSINGAVQQPTADYTVVAQTLTFTEAPFTDDEIVVRYIAI